MLLTRVKAKPCGAFTGPNETTPSLFLSLSRSNLLPFFLAPRKHHPEGFSAKIRDDSSKSRELYIVSGIMEDNLRRELHPAFPDLALTEGCSNELTPSNSVSSSLTVENSKDLLLQNVNAMAGKCTAWTDEKHRLYLDSLEASFVNQLHHSMGLLAWCSDSSRQLPVNSCSSSDQFTVLRDGCWKKINFEKNQPLLDAAADSHVILDSPWIHHFRCADKSRTIASVDSRQHRTLCSQVTPLRGKRAFSHGMATSLVQIPVCHQCNQDTAGSTTEVSDQNFVDEDQEDKSSTLVVAKRLKMAATDASSRDQIVPRRREEQVRNEWPSEVDSLICAKPEVKSFLRES